jgi:predicted nucleic acid-binding protein
LNAGISDEAIRCRDGQHADTGKSARRIPRSVPNSVSTTAEASITTGRLHRAGDVGAGAAGAALNALAVAPIERHPLAGLLAGAWNARERLRLVDALYVELARTLGSIAVLTTDARLARECDLADLIVAAP